MEQGVARTSISAAEFHLGPNVRFRPDGPELLIDGRPVKLRGRALDVLCTLVELHGQVVTKRRLMERAWPNLVVEENNLQVQISTLRRLLGSGSIVTVSGRGYRLVTRTHGIEGAPSLDKAPDARQPSPEAVPAASPTDLLLERDNELRALSQAWTAARAGGGGTCLVFGEAGIGKSSLCEAFLAQLGGVRVLRGGCEALSSPRPLGPLYDVVASCNEGLLAALEEAQAPPALFSRVFGWLCERPTVLLIEDLHWADEATLDLVKHLGRRTAGTCLLLIVTFRDDELNELHPLRQVIGDLPRSAVRLSLRPLSPAAVRELARQAGRTDDGLLETTAGNPFFVTEVLEGDGMPETVVDAVHARFARQSPAVRELLERASTMPGRVDHWVVEGWMDPSGAATQEALSSGLMMSDRDGLRFRHEIARRAVEQRLSATRLRKLHGGLLDFMSSRRDRPVPAARLVHHAKAAGRLDDVLRHAPVAAREASRRGGHREAAALYALALDACPSSTPELRAELLEDCAWENMVDDDAIAAIERLEEALALRRSLVQLAAQGRVLVRLARSYWSRCRGDDCARAAAEAVELLQGEPRSREYLDALVEVTRSSMLRGHNAVALEVGAKALALAQARSDERLVAHLLNNIGTSHCQAGDLATGIPMLERSLTIGRRLQDEDVVGRYYINLAYQLVEHRRYDAADRLFAECERVFPIGGDSDWYYWQGTGWQSHAQLARGRWEAAQTSARRALARYRSTSTLPFSIHALLVLARLEVLRGGTDADEPLAEATRLATSMGEPQRVGPAACVRCEKAWLRGESLEPFALEVAELQRGLRELGRQTWVDELGYWLWRCGLEPQGVDPASARGLQIAGQWAEAAERWRSIGCPLEEGQALLDGDSIAVDQAARIFERLGAAAYLAWMRASPARPAARRGRPTRGPPNGLSGRRST